MDKVNTGCLHWFYCSSVLTRLGTWVWWFWFWYSNQAAGTWVHWFCYSDSDIASSGYLGSDKVITLDPQPLPLSMIRITVKLESGLAISLFVNFNKDYCNTDRWFCGWSMHRSFQVTKGWASDLTIIITCSKEKGWLHHNVLCRQKGCQCNNKQQ